MLRAGPAEATRAGVQIGDRLVSVALGWAIAIAERLGVERTQRVGLGVGRLWGRLRGPRTRRVERQLSEAFPEQDAAWVRTHARGVFENLAQTAAEGLLLAGRHRAELVDSMDVLGLEHLEAARRSADGLGALVVGPHLGNWELGAAKLASLGLPVSAVYRGPKRPALDALLRRLREGPRGAEGGLEHIAMGSRAGVRFVRALRSGRNVLALLDQRARGQEALSVTFFGRPAPTRFAPLKLALRANAPVLIAFARRENDRRRHTLTIEPALPLERSAHDDDEALGRDLQRVTAAIEDAIRTAPDQWIWTHRRWVGGPVRSGAG